nr:MAG TPA: hypothetical protein [Bacteriophage sp.]
MVSLWIVKRNYMQTISYHMKNYMICMKSLFYLSQLLI